MKRPKLVKAISTSFSLLKEHIDYVKKESYKREISTSQFLRELIMRDMEKSGK
jgi:hypothetical protein